MFSLTWALTEKPDKVLLIVQYQSTCICCSHGFLNLYDAKVGPAIIGNGELMWRLLANALRTKESKSHSSTTGTPVVQYQLPNCVSKIF